MDHSMVFLADQVMLLTCMVYLCAAIGDKSLGASGTGSATLRSGTLSVLGYTNNALSHEQKAQALAEILRHATAGHLTADREALPLAKAAQGWSRCGKPPYRRPVLIP